MSENEEKRLNKIQANNRSIMAVLFCVGLFFTFGQLALRDILIPFYASILMAILSFVCTLIVSIFIFGLHITYKRRIKRFLVVLMLGGAATGIYIEKMYNCDPKNNSYPKECDMYKPFEEKVYKYLVDEN